MTDPRTGRPFRCLTVADVDLDAESVAVQEPVTPLHVPPEGVHALAWLHGRPLGELTVPGDPEAALAGLVVEARTRLSASWRQHLLHDALSTPGGLTRARAGGLAELSHPDDGGGPTPSISVAVCTRDRPDALRSCLQALKHLRDPVVEILVVDNASQDTRTREVVAEFEAVRYVSEPRRGLDWARNRALLEATGEVLAYTDDDVEVHPDWVGGLQRAFREEPAATAVTGLVVPRELSTPPQVLFELTGGFGRGFRRKWYSACVEQGSVAARLFGTSGVAGTGANLALRRLAALELGGFDTALDVGTTTGGGGDLEMLFRVVAAGGLVVYEPSAVVRHVHRPEMALLLRQMRGNGTGAFSFFLGAGQRYPPVEARQFRRLAARFAAEHYVRGYVEARREPDVLPPALLTAEIRGAWDAVTGSFYRRARQQADGELLRHGGPVPEAAPVRGGALHRPSPADGPVPVVQADLAGPGPVGATGTLPGRADRQTQVVVVEPPAIPASFTCVVEGSPLSPSRLRWAVVDALGTGLLTSPSTRTTGSTPSDATPTSDGTRGT